MTEAVLSRQPLGTPLRGRSDQSLSRFIGTRRDLRPLPPLSLPSFLSLPFGVFLNTQVHPSPWCVPGRLFRSWEHLSPFLFLPPLSSFSFPLSLSLSLSFFFSFFPPLSFLPGCPWMLLSLLGTLLFFSWCVLGRLCRSWEHRRFLFCFSFFSLFSPSPPSLVRGVLTY